jgi:putative endonuclease
MAEHNLTGSEGEQLACRFLEEAGHALLERNWKHGRHELDIVARDAGELVFVEVKTRSSDRHGQPEEAVGKGKRGRMIRAANAYIERSGCTLPVRFDIISIILVPGGKPFITHLRDAFYPTTHDRPY